MLRRNKRKLVSNVSNIDILLEINKLKAEKELIEKENIEVTKVLDAKRKSIDLDYKSYEIIENEHFSKIEKANNEYVTLLNDIDNKNKELEGINERTASLLSLEEKLNKTIPILEDKKNKLEIETTDVINRLNLNKKNSEIYLSNLTEKIGEERKIYEKLSEKVGNIKREYKKTMELINLENNVLGKRQRDLQIYEARLRKKYPNDKIII